MAGNQEPVAVEDLLRESAPRVLAALVRRFGHFADAEDAAQEAMIDAARQWPSEGVPENPVGWLVHVGSRRMTDRIRSESARREREDAVAAEVTASGLVGGSTPSREADDTVALMFMCCHPALSPASAIALTLRAVAGLTTAQIAAAFLVPEATMGQRISRAKKTVEASGEPFGMPTGEELDERLRYVLRAIYLIFNEGYAASEGEDLLRPDFSAEAIRLARIVRLALPNEPEVGGLLAMMLLNEARRPARVAAGGDLIRLEEQDRSLWDRKLAEEGRQVLVEALTQGVEDAVGEYQLQAAIAAEHVKAERPEDTDWSEIAALYDLLAQATRNPMVVLNQAIATAMADGPRVGLALLAVLEDALGDHHRFISTRAHLLEELGDVDAAIAEYRRAAELTKSVPERDYLTKRAARLKQQR